MNQEREMAILAMQNMSWTAKRLTTANHPKWVFTRPDTGGLWDKVEVPQANLSMLWVASTARSYGDAPDLVDQILALELAWLKSRFAGIYAVDNQNPWKSK